MVAQARIRRNWARFSLCYGVVVGRHLASNVGRSSSCLNPCIRTCFFCGFVYLKRTCRIYIVGAGMVTVLPCPSLLFVLSDCLSSACTITACMHVCMAASAQHSTCSVCLCDLWCLWCGGADFRLSAQTYIPTYIHTACNARATRAHT